MSKTFNSTKGLQVAASLCYLRYLWQWKWKSLHPVDSLQPDGLHSPCNSPGQNTGVGFPPPGDLPNPGIEPRSPTLQAGSLPAEPPGKPKNTGVGSPSLLQGIFPTWESNWGLLHCRQILYQLSYQGSPYILQKNPNKLFGPSDKYKTETLTGIENKLTKRRQGRIQLGVWS